jgi:hypothetical protein
MSLRSGLLYFNSVIQIIELEFLCVTEMGGGGVKSYSLFYVFMNTCGRLGCFMYVNIFVASIIIFIFN